MDPFARGSYSYVHVGASGSGKQLIPVLTAHYLQLFADYDELARPIGNLFFAGEATWKDNPATVGGKKRVARHRELMCFDRRIFKWRSCCCLARACFEKVIHFLLRCKLTCDLQVVQSIQVLQCAKRRRARCKWAQVRSSHWFGPRR